MIRIGAKFIKSQTSVANALRPCERKSNTANHSSFHENYFPNIIYDLWSKTFLIKKISILIFISFSGIRENSNRRDWLEGSRDLRFNEANTDQGGRHLRTSAEQILSCSHSPDSGWWSICLLVTAQFTGEVMLITGNKSTLWLELLCTQ